MAWIRTIEPEEATGLLERLYRGAIQRAGKVFNVIQIQGLRPKILKSSTHLYREVMFGEDSPLSRVRREMIATVVSQVNHCRY